MAKARLQATIGMNTSRFKAGIMRLKRMGRSLNNKIFKPLKQAGRAMFIGAIAGAAALAVALKKVTDKGDLFGKMSKRTGIAADELQRYAHAADLSGASIESVEKAVKRMAKVVRDGDRGLSTAVDALNELGLSADSLRGKSPTETFDAMTTAIAAVEDPLRKAALAQEVFGRAGTQLLPMLEGGAKGLADLKKEADDLGMIMSPQDVANAEKFKDELSRTKGVMGGMIQAWVGRFLPAINAGIEKFRAVLLEFRNGQGFATFGDKLARGAALLLAAAASFAKIKDKMTFIRDFIADGFRIGALLAKRGIVEAFEMTRAGQGIRFAKEYAKNLIKGMSEGEAFRRASASSLSAPGVAAINAQIAALKGEMKDSLKAGAGGDAAFDELVNGFMQSVNAGLAKGVADAGGVGAAGESRQFHSLRRIGANVVGAGVKDDQKKLLTVAEKQLVEMKEMRKAFNKNTPDINGRF